jgi:uncharacterized membrane protein (UPF0136 family)
MSTLYLPDKIAAGLAGLYGLVSLVGGVMGYVKASSVASLAAGGGSGVLLLACAAGTFFWKPAWSLAVAAVIAIALLGRFLPKAIHPAEGTEHHTAYMVALVMTVGGVLVLLAAGFALAGRSGAGG